MQYITKIFNYTQSPVQNNSPQLKREDWDDWVEVKGNNIDPLLCSQIVSATSPNKLILLEDYNSDHQVQSHEINNVIDNVWTLSTIVPQIGNDIDKNKLELNNPTEGLLDEISENWKEEVHVDCDSDSEVVNSTNDSDDHINQLNISIDDKEQEHINLIDEKQLPLNTEIPKSSPYQIQKVEVKSYKTKKNPSPNKNRKNKKKKKNSPKSNQLTSNKNNPLLNNPSIVKLPPMETQNQNTSPISVTTEQTSIINQVNSTMSDTGGNSPQNQDEDILEKVTDEIDQKEDEKNEKLEVTNEPSMTIGGNPWHNPNEISRLRQKLRALGGEKI